MICLRFTAARLRMQTEKKINPENQVPFIIENYVDFLKVIIGEEERDFIHLKDQKDARLQKLAGDTKNSPWYLYSQSLVYLQCGMARIKFGEYVNASLDINRAYRLLTENQRKYSGFVLNKVGLGVLHALIGTVPDKYRWATRSLSFEGTVLEGNAELKDAYMQIAADPQLSFMLPETAFLLAFVTMNLSADMPAAIQLAEKIQAPPLSAVLSESPLMVYACANIYARAGENDKVLSLLSGYPTSVDRYPFYYLSYMLGVAKLNRLDTDANYPFLNFLGNFKGKNYIRSAYMHLAWYYLLQNDSQQYSTYLGRIRIRGNNQVDNDREALIMAGKNTRPDIRLLKARLLFDGGYYARALKELEGFKAVNPKSELEYSYRLGRIYHNWGKTDQAISYYKETILKGDKLPYFYAANAALQLGLIYESQKNYSQARTYFSKVQDMDFEEYQFSISNKAQAGLNRVKGK